MFFLTGKNGRAVFTRCHRFKGRGIFSEEGEFHLRKRIACFTGVGVKEGRVAGQFPGEADVGDLDEGLDDRGAGAAQVRVLGGFAGNRNKEGGIRS